MTLPILLVLRQIYIPKLSNPTMDKWRPPTTLRVYLYIPNIIVCFKDRSFFSILYFVSFVCDALDGWFARKLNQVSTFGAVLDMVTDRISTARLLVILSQFTGDFCTFLVGKSSHKDVRDSSNWLFKLYYGNQNFMCYCCGSSKETENLNDVLVTAVTQSWLCLSSLALVIVDG